MKDIVKDGYEFIKVILDDDLSNPYYFIVKTKDKQKALDKIFKLSKDWTLDIIKNKDNYSCFDDCLETYIKKGFIKFIPLPISEYNE
jgi:hypothetical protein